MRSTRRSPNSHLSQDVKHVNAKKNFRTRAANSVKRHRSVLAALLVVGMLGSVFAVASGRAAGLGFRWPISFARVFVSGTPSALPQPSSAPSQKPLAPLAANIITSTGTAFTENFDGMGSSGTATLPAGFKIGTDWSTGTTATTLAFGTTGTGVVTSSSSGGTINWANGVTASATDRSLGFLNTGTFTSPKSIVLKMTNSTGATITQLDITFDYEKSRSGSRQYDWTFFHGSTTTPATSATAGDQSYPANADNTVVSNPPLTMSKTVSLTGLSIANASDYYVKWTFTGLGGSTNGQGIGIDNFSVTATAAIVAPTTQASNINFSSVQANQMTANWTNGNGTKRVVKINTSNSFTDPTDGTDPSANAVYGGSGEQVVFNNTGTNVTVTNLTASTTYWFRVYEYNGSGAATKFLTTTATNNPNSQVTTSGAATPTKLAITSISPASPTAGSGFDVTVQSQDNTNAQANVGVDTGFSLSNSGGGAIGGTTTGTITTGTSQVVVSGVTLSSAGTGVTLTATRTSGDVLTAGTSASFTVLSAEPTSQASSVQFSAVGSNAMTVSWTNGNGANRIVLAKQGSAVDSNPIDGTTYTASTTFTSGTQIGTGNYVVFAGSGNSVTVTGLAPSTTYHFAVYEFNGSGGTENYLTTAPATGNQATTAATYTWNQTGSASWATSTNWTPTRTTPATTDILQFNAGGSVTVTSVPTQTIGQLIVSNTSTVNLQAAGTNTLTISGGSGADLSVESGSQLNVNGASALAIVVATTATGSVSGSMTFTNAAHTLNAADTSGVTFASAATLTQGTGCTGNVFTTGGTANAIVFASGSTFIQQAGSNPFGLGQPATKVVFQTGSLFSFQQNSAPAFSGRTYANLEINAAGFSQSTTGGATLSIDDLTITNGVLNVGMTGTFNLKGNVSVASGQTLNFNPASASNVSFNGTSAQTISGAGTLTFVTNQGVTVNNAAGLTLQRNVTLNGSLSLTSGTVTTGVNTLSIASTGSVARTSGYVIGNFQKGFPAAGSRNFEVGTANGYSPVLVNANTGTFPANFTVKAIEGAMPGISGANKLARYWTLTNSTITNADLTFNYLAGDVTGTVGSYQFIKKSTPGILTTLAPTGTPTSTQATINGVTSFSDWTLAEAAAVQFGSIQFSSASYNVGEGDGNASITVTRSGGSDGDVSVHYATSDVAADSSDYTSQSGTFTWLAGDATSRTITVPITNDSTYEGNEDFNVDLDTPGGGATLGSPNGAVVNIIENDSLPSFSISDVTQVETDSGTTNFIFTVTKTGATALNAEADFITVIGTATTADNDYVFQSGSVLFTPGDTTKPITIVVNGDTTYEANETFTVHLSNPQDATISDADGTGTITNDDAPPTTLVVNTTADGDDGFCLTVPGGCTLREAINAANSNIDTSTISFNIPVGMIASGVFTIQPTGTLLPFFTRRTNIDGATQTAFTGDTNANGPEVVINGALLSGTPNGLYFDTGSGSSVVSNLVVNGFGGTGVGVVSGSVQVLNNYIGTNATGTAAVANAAGLSVGSSATLTGSYTISGNLISGNTAMGISTCDVQNSTFSSNKLGTNAAGTGNVGNGSEGMHTFCGTFANNTISLNTIAFNGTDGFRDQPDYGGGGANNHPNNRITQNSFFDNGGLGINLLPPPNNTVDGVTPNDLLDPDPGGNNLQNFPVLTSSKVTGATKTIQGTLNTTPSSTSGYTIEFFSNAICDPSGNGEGKTYLGNVVTGNTNGSGNVSFTFHPASLTIGDIITATATDVNGNTSEFSACTTTIAGTAGSVQFSAANYNNSETNADHPATITVTRTGGTDGDVSVSYNTSNGTATLADNDYVTASGTLSWLEGDATSKTFDVTVKGDATYEANETVNLTLSVPLGGVSIGAPNPATLTITNDDAPPTTLVVNTTADGDDGFCLAAPGGCTLREAINAANSNIDTSTISFNIPVGMISGGVFTIQPTGTLLPFFTRRTNIDGATQTAFTGDTNANGPEVVINGSLLSGTPNGLYFDAGSTSSVVSNLVINGFGGTGVGVVSGSVQVLNNYIGTNAAGTAAVANAAGLSVGSSATLTGSYTISGNLISGNTAMGISTCDVQNSTFSSNKLGTNAAGTGNVGNGSEGMHTFCGTFANNTISLNTIAFNGTDGFRDQPDYGGGGANNHPNNRITQNSFFDNGGLGINLLPPPNGNVDGVTPNDLGDADVGGNGLQNFPVILGAVVATQTINGTLNSTASTLFTIELYKNTACDGSGNGEGATYIGSTTVTTDILGNGAFSFIAPPATFGSNDIFTSTATNPANNTSEFSACFGSVTNYTWTGTVNTDWQVAANWTPTRTLPSTADVLYLDFASTPAPIITNVPTQTIAALRLVNGVSATLSASAIAPPQTLTVSGGTFTDLSVPGGNLLTLAGANALKINIASGAHSSVAGQIIFQDGAHRLIGNAALAAHFHSGAFFTTSTGFTGNPFGTGGVGDGDTDSVVFESGSKYFHNAGLSPFGTAGLGPVAVFQSGNEANWLTSSGFQGSGRVYSTLIIGNPSTATSVSDTGPGDFQFETLIVNSTPTTNSSLSFDNSSGAGRILIQNGITSNGVGSGSLSDVILKAGTGGIVMDKQFGTITFGNDGSNTRGLDFESNGRVEFDTTLALSRRLLMGIIQPNSTVLTVEGNITGGPTGYVIGAVRKNQLNSGSFTFPVGKVTGYTPVDLTNISGANAGLTVQPRDGTASPLTPATSLQEYWRLTQNFSTLTTDLTFHYLQGDVNGTEGNYRLVIVESGNATSFPNACPSSPCVDTTANTITRTGVSTFSDWTAAEPAAPTAVKLNGFTATRSKDTVLLQWQSGYEARNLGYNIYREQNGKREAITPSLVAGSALIAGSNARMTAGLTYSWTDQGQAAAGSRQSAGVTYWLEDVDLNGTRTLHGPIAVSECGNADCGKINDRSRLLSELSTQNSALSTPHSGVELSGYPAGIPIPDSVNDEPDPTEMQRTIAGLPALKISVSRPGWYRITQAQVLAAGLNIADANGLQLYRDGRQVAFRLSNNTEQFGPAGYLEFYGEGLSSPTTKEQTYYLVKLANPGKRIEPKEQAVGPGDRVSPQGFAYTVERKERMIYFSSLLNGDAENFFGQIVSNTAITSTIPINHLDATSQSAGAPAQLEVVLQGVTSQSHLVQVRFNGTDLGTLSFANTEHPSQMLSVPAAAMHDGNNNIELTALGGAADVSLVDVLRLTYTRSYEADNNALGFNLSSRQTKRLTGFTSNHIRVVDISDPYNVLELTPDVAADGAGFAALIGVDREVRAPFSRPHELLAFADGDASQVDSISLNAASSLWSETDGADYVVITAGVLQDSVMPLAQLRQTQGLVVKVVDVEDLYDEFSFGAHSPQAIHDFLVRAQGNWTRKPHYVLLAGDASSDPKNYFGLAAGDLVPTKLIDTSLMETASDDWLADFNADGMSDLSLGRLPVRTASESNALVAKIVGYEQATPDPNRAAMLVADTNFEAPSGVVQGLLPASMPVTTINRSSGTDAAIHSQIIATINQGPLVANYIGHGSNGVWTGASLLSSSDAPGLTNTNRLSVFTMMTCFNGYFQDPANDSLSEALLKAPGGAVAVWASTTLTQPEGQTVIDQEFYRMLFGTQPATLGDAARGAKLVTGDADVRRTWTLFGDPAMRLR